MDRESGFGIAAAPKVGTLSIVHFLFTVKNGRAPKDGEATHQWVITAGMRKPSKVAFEAGLPMIAVHRDPFERIRSCYQHRVICEHEAPAVPLRDFCERLSHFREIPEIAWHTDPQTKWLGDRAEPYAATLGLDDLHLLPSLLKNLTGREYPEMPWAHRMESKPPWEEGLKEILFPWVSADLDAGWNGTTNTATKELIGAAPRSVCSPPESAPAQAPSPPLICLDKYRDYKKWGWYRLVPGTWLRWVSSRHPIRALEIGAFDGVSANIMLDSIFPHPESRVDTIDPFLPDSSTPLVGLHTRALFEENTRRGGHGERVCLHVGKSLDVLARMISDGNAESYDVVFIDGSHLAADVMTDAVLGWPLLKPGGIIVFDDFEWGGNLLPHCRPKEAINAFESAFVQSLVPLVRGWQRIYRKTGVPGGLRDFKGEAVHRTCAIIGTYDSGSSLLASIMECLGFDIARPTHEDFYESASLRNVLIGAIDEPQMVLKKNSSQLVAELAAWHTRIKPGAPALCVKHPLLGLCLPELLQAWGPDTVFIHAKRPLEKSIRGLKRRGWFTEPERMQRTLNQKIGQWLAAGRPFVAVEYEELLVAPEKVIAELARALGIQVPESVMDRALALIERRTE